MSKLSVRWYSWVQAHTYRDDGQGAIEYALVIGLVSIAAVLALQGFANGWLTSVDSYVTSKIPKP